MYLFICIYAFVLFIFICVYVYVFCMFIDICVYMAVYVYRLMFICLYGFTFRMRVLSQAVASFYPLFVLLSSA